MLNTELFNKGVEIIGEKLAQDDRELLYLVCSGSHAWGLERPDSDIDLRGIYKDPLHKVISVNRGADTIEYKDGLYDFQLYEVEKFLRMLCNHNGNMVNMLWLPQPRIVTLKLPFAWLSTTFLTKRLRYYYRGYAEGQRKRAMSERGGKALIYTYREMFSGLHTLMHGSLEHDFKALWKEAVYRKWYRGSLLDKYFPDPCQEITDEGWHKFYSEWEELCIELDKVADMSPLPDTFNGHKDCSAILLSLRLGNYIDTLYGTTMGKTKLRSK